MSAGALDTSFNGAGKVVTPIVTNPFKGTGYDRTPVVVYPNTGLHPDTDGKIVAGKSVVNSNGSGSFALVRYDSSGNLDTTFGNGGVAPTTVGGTNSYLEGLVQGLAIDANRNIVAVGWADNPFVVARFLPDGSLDTSFGGTGIVVTNVNAQAYAVAIDGKGKIDVTGLSDHFTLVRYNPDGTLDSSLNGNGIVITPSFGSGREYDQPRAVAIQPDGRIVLAGIQESWPGMTMASARYNVDGSLDTSFNGTGIAWSGLIPAGSTDALAFGVTIQSDGGIVLAGDSDINGGPAYQLTLARLTSAGQLDTSFGASETGFAFNSKMSGAGAGIAQEGNGDLVVACGSFFDPNNPAPQDMSVAAFLPGGTLDTTFGTANPPNGTATVDFGGAEVARGIAIQPDGKILVSGMPVENSVSMDPILLARFLWSSWLEIVGIPSSAGPGAALSFTVTAKNADGTTNVNYTGTLHFTSSDPLAVVPADYTFTAADLGTHTFTATFGTRGTQSIIATDTKTSELRGFLSHEDADPVDLSQSTITVTPASIPSGGSATVTLVARNAAGTQQSTGGWPFSFDWAAGGFINPGSGAFSNLTDHHDGTYTATFTGTTVGLVGTITITATLDGQPLTSTPPTITVLPAVPATQLAITNLTSTNVTAGSTVTISVTAEDSTGMVVPSYTGTVQLTSTDGQAAFGGQAFPTSYTFVPSDHGLHTFTVTLATPGTQTITVTDQANNSLTATTNRITVTSPPKFLVNVPGNSSVVAGEPFLFTVQAVDAFGNPLPSYSGPTTVSAASSPPDPQNAFTGTLNSNGFGLFLGNLKTAGSYTLTVTAGSYSGTSSKITVTPGPANYFTVSAPSAATTSQAFDVTVTAFDHFGNVATGYTGAVKLTSTDPAATLPGSYTFKSGPGMANGVDTFSVTLATGSTQTITATDTASTNPTITGTSNPITTRGLTVLGTPTVTATGVTVNFSKPFVPGDLNLYGPGSDTVPAVTLVGKASGPINGSLLIDPSNTSVTFKATNNSLAAFFGAPVLPDDTYTLTLASGKSGQGFADALSAGLDGANDGGHADYTTTFTVANAGKPILSIPDFARGPDGTNNVRVPNDSAHGIPVTLTNAIGVKDVSFILSYNPALLSVTGASTQDASGKGSVFTLVGAPTLIDPTHATASFSFHNDTPQTGAMVLGDIVAHVPDTAASSYKAKERLSLSGITLNGAAFTGVSAGGVHVNAYLGDVTGNGAIDGLDLATVGNVARGAATGLAAYQLLDPAIIGDVAGDIAVDAGDVSDLAAFTAHVATPAIPAIPTGLAMTPSGADPTLSLGSEAWAVSLPSLHAPRSTLSVPVLLDQPHPEGSSGLTEAVLALTYNPDVLSVSAADITFGTIPNSGTGWLLKSVIDQATGQIGIVLYSTTPITSDAAGSLVNITFHVRGGPRHGTRRLGNAAAVVQLLSSVTVDGQEFRTQLDDVQGGLVLSAGADRADVVRQKP